MFASILKILDLVLFILGLIKDKSSKNEQEKKELKNEAKEALLSGDVSRINIIINKLRK